MQAAQWAVVLRRSVSQPAAAVQSPYPPVHAPIWQVPVPQYPTAFGNAVVQLFPQEPQFVLSLLRLVSQPSRTVFSLGLQSPYPAAQAMLHCAPMQLGVPWFELQAVPHPPQLAGFPLVSVSQPSRLAFSFGLQSLQPRSQVMVHAPATQAVVPCAVLQAALQAPQWAAVPLRSTSQPSPGSPLQSAQPALHTYWHDPSEHPVAVMCAGVWSAHTYPQAPQLLALVFTSVSQPSVLPAFRSALQSFHPVSHVC